MKTTLIYGDDDMKWRDVVEIYKDAIEHQTVYRPEFYTADTNK